MDSFIHLIFFVFAGAAVLATVALYTRQPLLVAYIALGVLLGPSGLGQVDNARFIEQMASVGIVFLLFLLGLDMQPRMLIQQLRESIIVLLLSTLVFILVFAGVAFAFGTTGTEALIIGGAATLSSTIVGIKLLPTTVLHHKHVGSLVVSLTLLQDIVAIVLLLALDAAAPAADTDTLPAYFPFVALPVMVGLAFATVRWVLLPLIARFDTFQEFMFLLALGWCLALAVAAEESGLSLAMGGFVAGVTLASHPISQYMAETLRPLRDFFLVMFFFSVGASFDLSLLNEVLFGALVLSALVLVLKPLIFRWLLSWHGESTATSWEVGWRLGQLSEFSLLLAYLAAERQLISNYASHLVQATTILTLAASSYLVVFRYPSPISPIERLRRN